MKRIAQLSVIAVLTLGAVQVVSAQSTPTVAAAKAVQADARLAGKITAVDKTTRVITMENAKGESRDFQVGPEVKNFDQIKVGDMVSVDYQQAIAIELLKGGSGFREKRVSESGTSAPLGEKPSGAVQRTTVLVSDVTAVDTKKRTVTLKTPEGKLVTAHVQDPKVLAAVKKGDQVVATIRESIAVAVTSAPPPAKK
ncbi:MAG: hypothetical protein QM803_09235 [Rhodocyclaceae bacterium]